MENITPWMLCCGIFGVLPLGAFGLGYYFGKYGVEIKLNRPEGRPGGLFGRKKKKGSFAVDEN
jgi:hypothetical protein